MTIMSNALPADRFEIALSLDLLAVIVRPNGQSFNVTRHLSNTVVVRFAEPAVAVNVVQGDALIPSSALAGGGWGNLVVVLTVRPAE